MKIAHNIDVVGSNAPSAESGTDDSKNPQIGVHPIIETAGERARGSVTEYSISKAQPFKTKGSGYTGK